MPIICSSITRLNIYNPKFVHTNLVSNVVKILKYFTFELWEKASSVYEEDRTQAEKLWNENCLQYQEEYEKVKKRLSIEFVKYFEANHEFHDWYVKKLITNK